jgi:hypothetical protein
VRRLLIAAAAAALLAGCGDPAKLDSEESSALRDARAQLDDAIDTEEVLRTDRREGRRLVRELKRNAAAFQLVPALVDETALSAFRRYAPGDPARALRRPAAQAVARMTSALEEADAETKISALRDQSAEAYLREAERDTRPIWSDLSDRLREAREDLG